MTRPQSPSNSSIIHVSSPSLVHQERHHRNNHPVTLKTGHAVSPHNLLLFHFDVEGTLFRNTTFPRTHLSLLPKFRFLSSVCDVSVLLLSQMEAKFNSSPHYTEPSRRHWRRGEADTRPSSTKMETSLPFSSF